MLVFSTSWAQKNRLHYGGPYDPKHAYQPGQWYVPDTTVECVTCLPGFYPVNNVVKHNQFGCEIVKCVKSGTRKMTPKEVPDTIQPVVFKTPPPPAPKECKTEVEADTLCYGDSVEIQGVVYKDFGYVQWKDSNETQHVRIVFFRSTITSEKDTTVQAGQGVMFADTLRTTSGTYRDTLQSSKTGCDSIVILHLVVQPLVDTEQKLTLRPFVEQVATTEIGRYGYPNGRFDLPTYVGLWILNPQKNFQLNAAIGIRGKGQQRFGQLKARDCDCDDGTPIWSFRTQGAYNFWSRSNKSFAQVGIQYEKILSGARIEREYPGLNLSKNWKPYGTAAVSLKIGHDWHLRDKRIGGSVLRVTAGTTFDATHGVSVQASAAMIFVGKKELPARMQPDATEQKIHQTFRWVSEKVSDGAKWVWGKIKKAGKKKAKNEPAPIPPG